MSALYPSQNDREFDLLKKITNNTAEIDNTGSGALTQAQADLLYIRKDGSNETGVQLRTLAGLATTSTDNAIVRFDGITGQTQNSVVTVADTTGRLGVLDGWGVDSAGSIDLIAGGSNKSITLTPSGTGSVLITGTKTLNFGATSAATIGVSADTTAGILQLIAPNGTGSMTFSTGAAAVALTISSVGNTTASGNLSASKGQNGATTSAATNTTAGTTSRAVFTATSDTAVGNLDVFSSLWSTLGADNVANGTRLLGTGDGGLSISASNAAGTVKIFTASAALSLTISGGAASVLTGGDGSMTIVAGTGNSRALDLRTTTSGGVATTALFLSATQTATFGGNVIVQSTNSVRFGVTANATIAVTNDLTVGILEIKSPASGTMTLYTAGNSTLAISGGAAAGITGGAGSMTITAGTGNSRTLTLRTTTSGGTATAALTLNATQDATIGGNLTVSGVGVSTIGGDLTISGGDLVLTGTSTITGGAGNMTITSGTGASRTLILRSTTSGSVATTFLTGNADQTVTFAAGISIGGFGAAPTNGIGVAGGATVNGSIVAAGGVIIGGTNNMTLTSGTGASRTLTIQTTTSGSAATNALTINATQDVDIPTGNLTISTIGKTLGIKQGTNGKAGTFTVTAGAATVANTSITANSVVIFCLKTTSGSGQGQIRVSSITAATGFSVTGQATDNSTYNYIVIEATP